MPAEIRPPGRAPDIGDIFNNAANHMDPEAAARTRLQGEAMRLMPGAAGFMKVACGKMDDTDGMGSVLGPLQLIGSLGQDQQNRLA